MSPLNTGLETPADKNTIDLDGLNINLDDSDNSKSDVLSDNINLINENDNIIKKENGLGVKINSFLSGIKDKFDGFIESKGLTEQKELLLFEIRDNIILIIILSVLCVLSSLVLLKAPDLVKNYEKKIKEISQLKKEILTFQKKTQGNEKYKDFSELLQYGVKHNNNYYPSGGYLSELNKLYPTKEGLNFGTFTEGWTSDFISWRGEKIRIPKDILKEYKVAGVQDIDGTYQLITYDLKLIGKEEDINKYLSLLGSLKLISKVSKINEEKIDLNNNQTNVTLSFYLKK